ncbi:MAG: xanthine dehydrogenase family protein subunit M [Sediminibacterium sp.]|nr:xanthine dehydrogenase family protein subunit M [Sediminibacterium sp.]
MKPFNYITPANLDEFFIIKNNKNKVLAGGTNLIDLMKKEIEQPISVSDLNKILNSTISSTKDAIVIGSMVKNAALANNEQILQSFPLVSKALLAGASPQIRNMATVGGNLLQRTRCPYFYDLSLPCNKRKLNSGCGALDGLNQSQAIIGYSQQCVAVHPSDLCIALAALDSSIHIINSSNKNEIIAFKDFHRLPENNPTLDNNLPEFALIDHIEIKNNPYNKNYAYVKIRNRDSFAFALISVAAALELKGNQIISARLASGGVAHKPWRWYKAEDYLKGKTASIENFNAVAKIIIKDVSPLKHNKYKVTMLEGAVVLALQNCLKV